MTTQVDIAAKNRSAARRFFWMLLILATATSLYGNIAHAIGGTEGVNPNRVIGASIAPVFLMALVHGVAHLARNTASGWAYGLVVALVGSVAAFAFAQSYGALTAFARDSHVLAPGLTPLIVDATIGVSTFALVVLGEKPTSRVRNPRPATPAPATPQVKAVAPTATATHTAPPTATPNRDMQRGPAPKTATTATTKFREPASPENTLRPVSGDATSDLAAELVRDKATRQPVEIVRAVIAAHNNGDPLNRIAKDVDRHHTAVKRIIDAAAVHRQRQLAAVG
jgi:hypothetical protein